MKNDEADSVRDGEGENLPVYPSPGGRGKIVKKTLNEFLCYSVATQFFYRSASRKLSANT